MKRTAKILELDRQLSLARANYESARVCAQKAKTEFKRSRKTLKLAKRTAKEARKKFKALKRALSEATAAANKPRTASTKKSTEPRLTTASTESRRTARPEPAATAAVTGCTLRLPPELNHGATESSVDSTSVRPNEAPADPPRQSAAPLPDA